MKTQVFRLSFEILSDFGYLPFLTRLFKALKMPRSGDLTQILVEAYNNAVMHAHRGQQERWVGMDLQWRDKKIRIRVVDQGKGFKPNRVRQASRWQTSGRGLLLIQTKADKIRSFRKRGHHIFEATCYDA